MKGKGGMDLPTPSVMETEGEEAATNQGHVGKEGEGLELTQQESEEMTQSRSERRTI